MNKRVNNFNNIPANLLSKSWAIFLRNWQIGFDNLSSWNRSLNRLHWQHLIIRLPIATPRTHNSVPGENLLSGRMWCENVLVTTWENAAPWPCVCKMTLNGQFKVIGRQLSRDFPMCSVTAGLRNVQHVVVCSTCRFDCCRGRLYLVLVV